MIAKIQQLGGMPPIYLSIYPSIHPVKCGLPNAAHHALKSGMIHHPWPQFSHVPDPWPYLSLSNGGLPGHFTQPQSPQPRPTLLGLLDLFFIMDTSLFGRTLYVCNTLVTHTVVAAWGRQEL